ncbi:MAG: UDP-glucose 4-epimerase GalE [Acidobacteriota bacterium]
MHVLVTGGAGYIGSHACKALAASGITPVTYDSLAQGHEWAVKWGPLERGDLHDRPRLNEVFKKYRPAAVLHFASLIVVSESVRNPGSYYRNNVAGTLSLLEAVRDHGVKHFIFSSSAAVYGMPESTPITEDHPHRPVNPYGVSKAVAENMLRDFDTAHGLKSVSLRYFNAAGADPEGNTGEAHSPETHLIPLLLEVAAGEKESARIFGDDYPTRDGTCIRDYIHVCDLADAHVAALRYLQDGGKTAAFNLGNGRGYSVKEVLDAVRRVTGRPVPAEVRARRPGDPSHLVASSEKARAALSWTPKFASLDTIVQHAWQWRSQDSRPTDAG